jgi:hypothetical protein
MKSAWVGIGPILIRVTARARYRVSPMRIARNAGACHQKSPTAGAVHMDTRQQTILAGALGIIGAAIPPLLWALDRMHVEFPYWIYVVAALISGICILSSLIMITRVAWAPIKKWFSRYLSLKDAAIKFYTTLRHTNTGRQLTGKTPERTLEHVASLIIQSIPVEVKKPPSTKWEKLPADEIDRLDVGAGGGVIRELVSETPVYLEARVKRCDLNRSIRSYRHSD